MKRMTKVFAATMAVVLAFAMCVAPAFAASITININDKISGSADENTTNEDYFAFKVLDAEFATGTDHAITDSNIESDKTDASGFTYKIQKTSDWYAAVSALTDYFTLTDKGTYALVELKSGVAANATTAKALASALKAYTNKGGATGTITPDYSLTPGEANTVADGYYLIISSLGEKLVLANTDITITEKNEYPTIEKTIASGDEHAAIGSTVTFTIEIEVPDTANQKLVFTDTMTDGLTFDAITSVQADSTDVAYTPTEVSGITVSGETCSQFVLTFSADTVKANQGKTIKIIYTAKVNKNAVDYAAETNTAKIDYSNYSQSDTATTQTAGFEILKYDGAVGEGTNLAGAHFTLKQGGNAINLIKVSDTVYRVADATETTGTTQDIVTVASGNIVVKGLDSDLTYTLTETTPPTNYNALTGDQTVTALSTTANTVTKIENNKGTQLPSTGGIGTTIFYIIGGLLIAGAVVVLITRRRMAANK